MRLIFLAPALLLAACTELPGEDEDGTIGYDQPANIAPASDELANETAESAPIPSSFHGRWAVSAADCEPDNLYMTEWIEIGPDRFDHADTEGRLAEPRSVTDKRLEARFDFTSPSRNWSEVVILEREQGDLIRWADDPSLRTRYERCA